MLRITTHRRHEVITFHQRQFDWKGERNWGFAFDSDEHGTVNIEALNPDARASWDACIAGRMGDREIVDRGVHTWQQVIWHPAEGRCTCGRLVTLDRGDTSCECGRDYNSAGQELAPRSQWGEETGESYADITRGGDPFDNSDY